MSAYFVDVPALEDVVTKGIEAASAWAEGNNKGSKEG